MTGPPTRREPALVTPAPDHHVDATSTTGNGSAAVRRDPELRPTIGAWQRAHGITDGRPLEAEHFLAVTVVDEARRQAVIRRLDPVLVALDRHRRPAFDDIARTLRRIADDLEAAPTGEAVAA